MKEVRPKHNLAYEGGDHTLLLLLKLASYYHDEANMLIYNILGEPPTPFKLISLNLEAVSGGHLFQQSRLVLVICPSCYYLLVHIHNHEHKHKHATW